MAKLTLRANPSFPAKVGIPVAGGEPVEMEFVFKHRTKTQLAEFAKTRAEHTDQQTILDIVLGWNFDEPFTPDNVAILLDERDGAALAIYQGYIDELTKQKLKN